jgi:uncharacterized protein (TIGR00369 family)
VSDVEKIRAAVASVPKPVCAALTPFHIEDADCTLGTVKIAFAEQPAFRNHFGHIQGGFAVAMMDVALSLAAFVKLGQWLPTVEIKSTFLAPAKLGTCIGEGRVLKAGQSLAFVEGRLWGADGQLAVHATATALVRAG